MTTFAVIGGNGRTGRHIVDQLQRDSSHAVRVLSRHGGTGSSAGVDTVTGSITEPGDVAEVVADATGVVVIVESSEQPGPNGPEAVHVQGVRNVIAAAPPAAHIVLVTQIYITRPEAFEAVRQVIVARGQGEQALRDSGRRTRSCGRAGSPKRPAASRRSASSRATPAKVRSHAPTWPP